MLRLVPGRALPTLALGYTYGLYAYVLNICMRSPKGLPCSELCGRDLREEPLRVFSGIELSRVPARVSMSTSKYLVVVSMVIKEERGDLKGASRVGRVM